LTGGLWPVRRRNEANAAVPGILFNTIDHHLRPKGAGWELRLHEKGGKHHVMLCRHSLVEALRAYIDAASIEDDRKAYLIPNKARHARKSTACEIGQMP
jgi:hypothetical protein